MKNLRTGVIGTGYLGRFHAQKYSALRREPQSKVDFIGVNDFDLKRAELIAAELGDNQYPVKVFATPEALLAQVDAVTIAASTRAHFDLAKLALTMGKHVNVEKPMTATLEQARELVALAESKQLILQVGHVERFNPALKSAQAKLLKPLFIECHRLAPFKPRGVDVDVVLDLMIHDLDVILSLVKSPVKSVSAVGTPVLTKTVDIANARIEFQSGTIANVTASRVSQSSTRKFRVFQKNQYLSIDFGAGDIHLTTKTAGDWPQDLAAVQGAHQLPLEIEHWSLEKGDALLEETRAFIAACLNENPVVVSGRDGLAAMELAQKIQAAIQIADRAYVESAL